MDEAKLDSTKGAYNVQLQYIPNLPPQCASRKTGGLDGEPERAMHLKRRVLQEKAAEGCKWVKSTPVCLPN